MNSLVKGVKPTLPLSTTKVFSIPNTHFFIQWELSYRAAELASEWILAFNAAIAGELGGLEALILKLSEGEQAIHQQDEWLANVPSENRDLLHDLDESFVT